MSDFAFIYKPIDDKGLVNCPTATMGIGDVY